MKLQWETDYALRCVLSLARKYTTWTRIVELAQELDIPEQMTRKLITRLCTAGILEGKPGPKGGVRLAQEPKEISVYDVVSCVEGNFTINRCLGSDGFCVRNNQPHCTVHRYLQELQASVEHSMRSKTFESLLGNHGGTEPEAT